MPVTTEEVDQLTRTGIIFTVGNLLLAPVYYASPKVGALASVVATLGLGYFLHEEGKAERAKAGPGFFAPYFNSPAEGAFNNVLAGGEKISKAYTG